MSTFDQLQKVADAVLYEGYALYPYRASSQKNRIRFQWGVLVPPAYTDLSERSFCQTQCLAERAHSLELRVRFLSLRARPDAAAWDDAREEQFNFALLLDDDSKHTIELENLSAIVTVNSEPLPGPYGLQRLTVRVENLTQTGPITDRDEALRHSLVGCHLLLALIGERSRFLSMIDPPQWATGYVAECENIGTFPVLAGDEGGGDRLMLSSPIILYDHPVTASESPTNLFDGLEIDEILTLRTMTLTDDEKREARATDPRVAALIDSVDFLPPEMLERLHGAIRTVAPTYETPDEEEPWMQTTSPWWDPAADASVDPTTDTVVVAGKTLCRGSRVRLRPLLRGTDAQDMFLTGREAQVEAVLNDVDGNQHLAVSLLDDPAADLVAFHGRYLYFSPDEVEPLGVRR